jgi:hypothetical protein
MQLSKRARAAFRRLGREGGQARARRLSPEARRTIARKAVVRRWIRARFGATGFAALGLPGGERIDQGLADLAEEKPTADALLVCLAAPRLQREGVPLPAPRFDDPERRLYRLLETTEGELAHARYLARLREAASFSDACFRLRNRKEPDAR